MLRCECCGWIGEENELIEHLTSYEAYYDAPVRGYHPLTIYRCPECGEEEDFTEFDEGLEEELYAERYRELREENHPVHEFRLLADILFEEAEKLCGLERADIIRTEANL